MQYLRYLTCLLTLAHLQCREAFERFDKDGSGTIDAWELKAVEVDAWDLEVPPGAGGQGLVARNAVAAVAYYPRA